MSEGKEMSTTSAMPAARLTARYEREGDGTWSVFFDESAHCGGAATLHEARRLAREAASLQFSEWEQLDGASYSAMYSHFDGKHYEVFGPGGTKTLWRA